MAKWRETARDTNSMSTKKTKVNRSTPSIALFTTGKGRLSASTTSKTSCRMRST